MGGRGSYRVGYGIREKSWGVSGGKINRRHKGERRTIVKHKRSNTEGTKKRLDLGGSK